MTIRTGVYVIIWRASFFKLSTSPVDLTLSVRPLLCRDDLLTRVIPQEAKDKALQALLGEPSAQAGGGCKDDHDHEGRKHQPDHHTGAQRHCESLTSQSAPGFSLSFIVCYLLFFLAAVCLEEAKRCAVQEVSRGFSIGD